jgi:hypothetical protein
MSPVAEWRVYTARGDFSVHESFEAALTRACGQIGVPHQYVRCIEGPNGERYEAPDIERKCRERRQEQK